MNILGAGTGKYYAWSKTAEKAIVNSGTWGYDHTLQTFLPGTAINHGKERERYNT